VEDSFIKYGFGAVISYMVIKELFNVIKFLINKDKENPSEIRELERHNKICQNLDEQSKVNAQVLLQLESINGKCGRIETNTTIIRTKIGS